MPNINPEQIFKDLCELNFAHELCLSRGMVDINEHLPTLRRYASECEHVTELGVRFGNSSHAFLIAKPRVFVGIDINYDYFRPFEEDVKNFAKACGVDFHFIVADVLETDIEETDLLFIDTLHRYAQLKIELERHHEKARKWIILHDTVTYAEEDEAVPDPELLNPRVRYDQSGKVGLVPAIEEFLDSHPEWTVEEHFFNNNGLSVLKRLE